jgi:hypothetical protein
MTQQVRTINIKGKEYVMVAERLRLVHEQRRSFEILESGAIQVGDRWVWKCVILINEQKYIGNSEVRLNAPKNTPDGTSPFECAETSAIGRALGMAGFGSVESICSADEMYRAVAQEEQEAVPARKQPVGSTEPATTTESQRVAIGNLFQLVGEDQPDISEWSFVQAATAIFELQARLKEKSNGRTTAQRHRGVPAHA